MVHDRAIFTTTDQ